MATNGSYPLGVFAVPPSEDAERQLPPRRALILETVRNAGDSVLPKEVANQLKLHVNTVREHLVALAEEGYLTRRSLQNGGRGRPSIAYVASPSTFVNPQYRVATTLINLFTEHLDRMSPIPETEARRMGEALGRDLASHFNYEQPIAKQVFRLAEKWGYEPRIHNRSDVLYLYSCPVQELRVDNVALIQQISRGVLNGILEECGLDPRDCHTSTYKKDHPCIVTLPPDSTNPPQIKVSYYGLVNSSAEDGKKLPNSSPDR